MPKSMAKIAISRATHSAVSANQAGCRTAEPVSTSMLVPTALYCSARYGIAAVSAITATSAASAGLLPNRAEIKSAIDVVLRERATATSRCRNGVASRNTRAGPR